MAIRVARRLDIQEERIENLEARPVVPEVVAAVVEEAGSDVFIIPKRQTGTGKLKAETRQRQAVHAALTMEKAYSDADLRTLCFDMGVDYEALNGEDKREKVRAIVGHFYRRNTLQIFIEFLEGDRPNWRWRVEEPKQDEGG